MTNKGPGLASPRSTRRDRRRTAFRRATALAILAALPSASRGVEVTSTPRYYGINWSSPSSWENSPAVNTYPNNGNLGNTYNVEIGRSPVTLDANVTLNNFTLNGRLVPGTSSRTLTVGNLFSLASGTLNVPVVTKDLLFSGTNNGTTVVDGTVAVSGRISQATSGSYDQVYSSAFATGRITLQSTARFDVTRTFILFGAGSSDPWTTTSKGSFVNAGTISVAPEGHFWSTIAWPATNSGTISVAGKMTSSRLANSGLLELTAPTAEVTLWSSTLAGSVRVGAGAHLTLKGQYLYLESSALAGASITNAGTITFDGPVVVTAPTTIPGYVDFATNTTGLTIAADTTFTGPVYLSSGATSTIPLINANATFTGPTTLNAWIGGTGRATASNLTFASGRIGVKEFVVPAGGKLSLPATSASRELSATTLRIHGTAEWAGGTLTASSTNRVEIAPGGVLRITPGAAAVLSPTNTTASPVNSLVNAGLLHVDHATLATAWRTTNSGTIAVDSGTLSLWNLANNTGTIRVTAGALRLLSLPATTTGSIDLHDGGVALFGNSASTLSAVRAQIRSGRNQGRWDGPGIHSSLAQADPAAAVGYLKITNAGIGTWRGFPVYNGEIVAASTLLGDATLDGVVDFNDLVKLAQHYNVQATKDWFEGDFTYDGKVDFNDLVKLAQNYNTTLPAPAAIPGSPPDFGADLARAFATVPEPAATPLLALAAACFTTRRRRIRPRKIPL